MTAHLENRKIQGWGGKRKGAGRKPKIARGDDYEERLAVYEALGALRERLTDRLKSTDQTSDLRFVLGYRVGIEGDIDALDRYRAEVRLEGELPVVRVRFRA